MTVTLKQGDCLELMKGLDDESVDCVITDPPFGLGYEDADWDKIDFKELIKNITQEFMRILKNGGIMFIYVPKKELYKMASLISYKFEVFVEYRDWGQLRNDYLIFNCWVPILCIIKGKPRDLQKRPKNIVFSSTANTSKNGDDFRKYGHITPKNVKVIKYLVDNFTKEGDTILDPFMGSGTTGVACVQLNRNFIGYEISPDYFKIAEKRIKEAETQRKLNDYKII
jgi:site-specific DNA-methyltransferase (adenine-specific)/modification methylase